MYQNALLTLHAVTFLHPGAGQSTGLVDLPVQRERHTGFPMLASSGLKGSLRDKAEQAWGRDNADVAVIFGSPEAGGSDSCAGALIVSDARILAFPVRSLQ
ncbi:MAG: type III-B CRISPR module RAMP protein Cmr4, partial [Calditrichaeota bacterium]